MKRALTIASLLAIATCLAAEPSLLPGSCFSRREEQQQFRSPIKRPTST